MHVEGVRIHADAARLQRILRQVKRKAIGIVQLERDLTGKLSPSPSFSGGLVVQHLEAALQRLAEPRLFKSQRLGDQVFARPSSG
jgi:hypothetical protein